mmetsp:Transcript_13532/g.28824  ORF Transcript_13532/g.28824 Transcript_13532/m.28824 type:complete len:258 (+) Transcript_13532:664-1437(+)
MQTLHHLVRGKLDGHVGNILKDGRNQAGEEPARARSLHDRACGDDGVRVHSSLHGADANRQGHLDKAAAECREASRREGDRRYRHIRILLQVVGRRAVEGEVGSDGNPRTARCTAHALVESAHLRLGADAKAARRSVENRLAGNLIDSLHPHLHGVEGMDDRLAASAGSTACEDLVEGRQGFRHLLDRGGYFDHRHLLVATVRLVLRRTTEAWAGELHALEKAPEGPIARLLLLEFHGSRHWIGRFLDVVKNVARRG